MTTTHTPKALVSINLPASNVMDPLVLSVTTETPLAGRVHREVLEARESVFFSDVDVRAEFRLWGGSTKRSMNSITGRGPKRHAAPSGEVVLAGASRPGEVTWREKSFGFHLRGRAAH